MAQEEHVAALATLLSSYQAFITYRPLRTEAAFDVSLLPKGALVYEIPPRAGIDPLAEAASVRAFVKEKETALLIPGRSFDASGTRHGQGGGWYDRFLAQVPREWLRIGFCFTEQFSPTPLIRQSWDQAMDYVVVVNRERADIRIYGVEESF